MRNRSTWTLLDTGIVTTAVGLAAFLGVKRARDRMTRNRAAISDTLPIHSAWWREHAQQHGDILYVALGDSAAQGIGATDPRNSYVGVIADHVRALTGRSVRVVNLSVSGATVGTAIAEQLPRFHAFLPDLVTVAIGANDIAEFDPDRFERELRVLFAAIPEHAIVANIPYFFLPHNERKVAVANRILREVAVEHGITVIPLHETMRQQGLFGVLTQFANDLFHPNDHGYRVWASAFFPAVTMRLANVLRATKDAGAP